MPGEVCLSLAQTPGEKGWPFQPAVGSGLALSSSTEALAQEPPPPGSSVGSDPSGTTSSTLPAAMRLPGEAPRLPFTGLLGSSQHCCVCGQSGATILCCEENCGKWFHLPCAKEGSCVNHYITPYRYLLLTPCQPWGGVQQFSFCPSLSSQVFLP